MLACLLMACCCISCHRAKERQQFQAEMSVLFEQEVARREKLEQEKSLAAQQQLRSFIQPPTPTTEQVVRRRHGRRWQWRMRLALWRILPISSAVEACRRLRAMRSRNECILIGVRESEEAVLHCLRGAEFHFL